MKRKLPFSLFFSLLSVLVMGQSSDKNYEFRNGLWYNGTTFVSATWYSNHGILSKKAPSRIDSVVDLTSRWVIPAIGDAYSSCISDNPSAANMLSQYMSEGVFYLQILDNTQEGRSATAGLMNKPTAPDAVFSNGAITATLGTPFLSFEGPANKIRNPNAWGEKYNELKTSRKQLGNGYWFIDNQTALNANWDKIKAQKPGVISIYLLDADKKGGQEGKGLSVDVAKLVIKKAHKSGLRVYAHVENGADVATGMKLGVDGFANMPGSDWNGEGSPEMYEITETTLKLMAKKKTPLVTLLSHGQSAANRAAVQDFHKKILKRYQAFGVNIVMGSNDSQRTIRSELNYWFGLGELDDAFALKVLCENTPKAIFPDRKIGRIEDGYEASFLALSDNPLTNVLKTRIISVKVKNGHLLP